MMVEYEKCPYCKKKQLGYIGRSIVFCCGGRKGEFYRCEMCKAEWREETKEVLVKRVRIGG
jgi:hypothetical protein